MESQHCMACSGVIAAPQSNAYAARATASAARKIGLAKRIIKQSRRARGPSQASICLLTARAHTHSAHSSRSEERFRRRKSCKRGMNQVLRRSRIGSAGGIRCEESEDAAAKFLRSEAVGGGVEGARDDQQLFGSAGT